MSSAACAAEPVRCKEELQKRMDSAPRVGHTAGMKLSEKIAVSLPSHLAQRARQAVRRGRAASVSAYVASALEEKVKLDDLSALLDEMLTESGGPLTATEKRTADRALGVTRERQHRK